MKYLLLFFVFMSSQVHAQVGSTSSACIWQGSVANCLPSNGLLLRNERQLRLGEATVNGSDYIAIKAPASLAANVTLTLPSNAGNADEILRSNGSGVLTWTAINSPSFFTTGAAASASNIGIVTTGVQTIAGVKTFNDTISTQEIQATGLQRFRVSSASDGRMVIQNNSNSVTINSGSNISFETSLAAPSGLVIVHNVSNGLAGLYLYQGGSGTVTTISALAGYSMSIVNGSGTNSIWRVTNTDATTRGVRVSFILTPNT